MDIDTDMRIWELVGAMVVAVIMNLDMEIRISHILNVALWVGSSSVGRARA